LVRLIIPYLADAFIAFLNYLDPSYILHTSWLLWLPNIRQEGQIILYKIFNTNNIGCNSIHRPYYVHGRCQYLLVHQLRGLNPSVVYYLYYVIKKIYKKYFKFYIFSL